MEIKFRKKLSDFDWLVMFDLASKTTGVCLWDIAKHRPIDTYVIKVTGEVELPGAELWNKLDGFFLNLISDGYDPTKILVSKEKAPVQCGKFTTAKTLIALGKAHAVLDLYTYQKSLAVFDYEGVAPATTHAYYKHLKELPATAKVEKEDLRSLLEEEYSFRHPLTLDESDAVFLAKTLVEEHWNKTIDEQKKELRRHKKELKASSAVRKVDAEIARLETLKD